MLRMSSPTALVLLALFAPTAFSQGMPDDVLKTIESNMVGEWGLTITYDGEASKGTHKVAWAPGGKYAAISTSEVTNSKGVKFTTSSLLGWDDVTKALREHGFSSDGEAFTVVWSDFSKDKWQGQVTAFYANEPMTSLCTVEFHGDKYVYKDTSHGKPYVFEAVRR